MLNRRAQVQQELKKKFQESGVVVVESVAVRERRYPRTKWNFASRTREKQNARLPAPYVRHHAWGGCVMIVFVKKEAKAPIPLPVADKTFSDASWT